MSGSGADLTIFWLVVAGRLLLPLLIFRCPLPGILACMVLDGIDQTVFQLFTGLDLTHYQSFDKALDIYYLSLAYLAIMRNWTNRPTAEIARFLYFYRMIGAVIFELSGGVHRWLLLVFPNTFEYYFICYEVVRLRWNPASRSRRFWILAAAAIWVVIKIPQELWIHVLQLDFTDTWRDVSWFAPTVLIGLFVLLAVFWFVLRPRLDPADHGWQVMAGPLPEGVDEVREQIRRGRILTSWLAEKIAIVALLSVVLANIVPSVTATPLQITVSVTALIIVNSFVGLLFARLGVGGHPLVIGFVIQYLINLGLVLLANTVLPTRPAYFLAAGSFFLLLLTLVVVLYDRFRPVIAVRLGTPLAAAPVAG